jgi:ribosomal protein L21
MVETEAIVVVESVSGDNDDDISFNALLFFEADGVRIHDIFSNPVVVDTMFSIVDDEEEKGVISFRPKSSSQTFISM